MFNIPWGTFDEVHISTLVGVVFINLVLFLILRKLTRKKQILILFLLSFAGIANIAYNIWSSHSLYENLPLNFWSLNAIILPFAVLFRPKWACNLSLFWSLGSYFALIFNMNRASMDVFSVAFVFFYAAHLVGIGIPILLFELELVEKDFRTMKYTISFTLLAYTLAHIINVAINSAEVLGPTGEIIKVNYFSSIAPTDKILSFFYAIVNSPYWYMFLTIPVFILYMVWWYLPELLDYRRRTAGLRRKLKAIDKYYDEYKEEYIDEIIEEKYL